MRANSGLHDFIYLSFHGHLALQEIKEEGDHSRIDQIGEHSTNDRNDEERLDGIAVFIADGTHVGHGIGSSTQTEATYSCVWTR